MQTINFHKISLPTFLSEYWQKKPLVLRNAIPDFNNPLSPEELAGLALEEDIESRIVWETPNTSPSWHLKHGPFSETDFTTLPPTHWTLLVQGVDRIVPPVYKLLDYFNFIPQWRIDDVMISFATLHGSVGPHFDNYDVFLYQAKGRREWSLTTKECNNSNYINDLELRIMKRFAVEERIILEEGDMLYLPPHVGHYGISLSAECMTYSFGYRSYHGQELLDSLADYVAEQNTFKELYRDPNWSDLKNTAEIVPSALHSAQVLLHQLINNEELMRSWFGSFATRLEQKTEQQLPLPLENKTLKDLSIFINKLKKGINLSREPSCRFAYYSNPCNLPSRLFINGCEWDVHEVAPELLSLIANNRFLSNQSLHSFLNHKKNQLFLFELWKLQWLHIEEI